MSNKFVLHYKLQEKFKTIHSINISEYKVDSVILSIITLYMPLKT